MNMNKPGLLITLVTTVAMLCFVGGAADAKGPKGVKKHNHHSGHSLVGAKLKTEGTHQIDKKGKHTVSAEVKHGKIAGIHVKHDVKGDVPVTKYKTKKKMASLDSAPDGTQPADTDLGMVWIGYAYIDEDGYEEYYWFPAEEILDGDTGAIEYVPLA